MWSPQHYIEQGKAKGVPPSVTQNAVRQIEQVLERNADLPAILSLNHLAVRAQVPYYELRRVIERERDPYRHFAIRKRSGGRRVISVPNTHLMQAQRWLTAHVLNPLPVHRAAYAFKPGSSIVACAARHTGARWLVKMDILGFFPSVSEIQVYRVFESLGYQPLVAFELSRLSTWTSYSSLRSKFPQWRNQKSAQTGLPYRNEEIGHLPQGAPTSPMLSNLVMRDLDQQIEAAARATDLIYTRYSDDMTFSTRGKFTRDKAVKLIDAVSAILRQNGLRPNRGKTTIVPPGARKVVLGLTVDGGVPHLSRTFRDRLRQHLYYLEKFGPVEHMQRREFESVQGLRHHVRGLIDFARMVDPTYAEVALERFEAIDWPV